MTLLLGMALPCFWWFHRRQEAAAAPQPSELSGGRRTAADGTTTDEAIVDDACEHTPAGWYFLGPDRLIGFSVDSCAAAFDAWRRTGYPVVSMANL